MDLTAFILNIQQRTKENHHFVMNAFVKKN